MEVDFFTEQVWGLSCPSETLSLRWKDINWAEGKMLVRVPKLERITGEETRLVPRALRNTFLGLFKILKGLPRRLITRGLVCWKRLAKGSKSYRLLRHAANQELDLILQKRPGLPESLLAAMRYSVLAPGSSD